MLLRGLAPQELKALGDVRAWLESVPAYTLADRASARLAASAGGSSAREAELQAVAALRLSALSERREDLSRNAAVALSEDKPARMSWRKEPRIALDAAVGLSEPFAKPLRPLSELLSPDPKTGEYRREALDYFLRAALLDAGKQVLCAMAFLRRRLAFAHGSLRFDRLLAAPMEEDGPLAGLRELDLEYTLSVYTAKDRGGGWQQKEPGAERAFLSGDRAWRAVSHGLAAPGKTAHLGARRHLIKICHLRDSFCVGADSDGPVFYDNLGRYELVRTADAPDEFLSGAKGAPALRSAALARADRRPADFAGVRDDVHAFCCDALRLALQFITARNPSHNQKPKKWGSLLEYLERLVPFVYGTKCLPIADEFEALSRAVASAAPEDPIDWPAERGQRTQRVIALCEGTKTEGDFSSLRTTAPEELLLLFPSHFAFEPVWQEMAEDTERAPTIEVDADLEMLPGVAREGLVPVSDADEYAVRLPEERLAELRIEREKAKLSGKTVKLSDEELVDPLGELPEWLERALWRHPLFATHVAMRFDYIERSIERQHERLEEEEAEKKRYKPVEIDRFERWAAAMRRGSEELEEAPPPPPEPKEKKRSKHVISDESSEEPAPMEDVAPAAPPPPPPVAQPAAPAKKRLAPTFLGPLASSPAPVQPAPPAPAPPVAEAPLPALAPAAPPVLAPVGPDGWPLDVAAAEKSALEDQALDLMLNDPKELDLNPDRAPAYARLHYARWLAGALRTAIDSEPDERKKRLLMAAARSVGTPTESGAAQAIFVARRALRAAGAAFMPAIAVPAPMQIGASIAEERECFHCSKKTTRAPVKLRGLEVAFCRAECETASRSNLDP